MQNYNGQFTYADMDLLVYHLNNFIELYMLYKVLNSKWIE